MLFDAFLFCNEEMLLEIRLNELYEKVDRFILIESNKTFTGLDKPLYFKDEILGKSWIQPFLPKLDFYVCNLTEQENWARERQQRNYIKDVLFNYPMQDDDMILISDVDEIPNLSIYPQPKLLQISQLFFCLQHHVNECIELTQSMYYYYFNNFLYENPWPMVKIMSWKFLKENQPDNIRKTKSPSLLKTRGWHFSFLGDQEMILNKLHAFSHQELAAQFTEQNVKEALEQKRDLFNRPDCKMKTVPLDETFPKYILNNKERFAKYVA